MADFKIIYNKPITLRDNIFYYFQQTYDDTNYFVINTSKRKTYKKYAVIIYQYNGESKNYTRIHCSDIVSGWQKFVKTFNSVISFRQTGTKRLYSFSRLPDDTLLFNGIPFLLPEDVIESFIKNIAICGINNIFYGHYNKLNFNITFMINSNGILQQKLPEKSSQIEKEDKILHCDIVSALCFKMLINKAKSGFTVRPIIPIDDDEIREIEKDSYKYYEDSGYKVVFDFL